MLPIDDTVPRQAAFAGLHGFARRVARRSPTTALLLAAALTSYSPTQAITPVPPPRGKFGCIDATGRYAIAPIYDSIDSCSGSIIAVRRQGREAFLDDHGAMVLPTWFAAPEPIVRTVFEHGLEPVGDYGHVGYIDRNGVTRIASTFESAARFLPSGHAHVTVSGGSPYAWKRALIDIKGQFVVEPRDDWFTDLSPNGLAAVSANGLNGFGYMDRTGTIRIPQRFEQARMFNANGLAAIETGGKWGYIDGTGAFVIPPKYDEAHDFGSWAPRGLAAVVLDGRESFIDRRGWAVATLDPDMRTFADFSHGLAQAGPDRIDVGFVNEHGRMVIPPRFDAESDFSADGTAAVKSAGKWGFIDRTGHFVIQPQFDGARAFAPNGLASVWVGKKLGYIDRHGRIAIPPQYDSAESFGDNGLALVEIGRP